MGESGSTDTCPVAGEETAQEAPASASSATDDTVALPQRTLSRGKAAAYAVILTAGLLAAGWLTYRTFVPADCGCNRSRKTEIAKQAGGPLTDAFRVPVIAYPDAEPEHFEGIRQHAVALKSAGYAFLTLRQIAEAIREELPLPKRSVALTMDIGAALPKAELIALASLSRTPVTVFVDPTRIGQPGGIAWRDIEELQSHGIEVDALMRRASANTPSARTAFARALRSMCGRMPHSQPHLAIDATHREVLAKRLAADAGIRVIWKPGSSAVAPPSGASASAVSGARRDAPLGEPMILERVANVRPLAPPRALLRMVQEYSDGLIVGGRPRRSDPTPTNPPRTTKTSVPARSGESTSGTRE
jgi:hypothetical protein